MNAGCAAARQRGFSLIARDEKGMVAAERDFVDPR